MQNYAQHAVYAMRGDMEFSVGLPLAGARIGGQERNPFTRTSHTVFR